MSALNELKWEGNLILLEIEAATVAAIDELTKAAADEARANHWWTSQRGMAGLEGQIIAEPAHPDGKGVVSGRFGSSLRQSGFYGLFLERKTPFLRPAADKFFPLLGATIRRNRGL